MIPERCALQETPSRDNSQRTEWNVRDSDATVIFTIGQGLSGGSKLTAESTATHGKPWLHLLRAAPGDPAGRLRKFLTTSAVKVLNVARSKASKEPEIAKFVERVLSRAFGYRANFLRLARGRQNLPAGRGNACLLQRAMSETLLPPLLRLAQAAVRLDKTYRDLVTLAVIRRLQEAR